MKDTHSNRAIFGGSYGWSSAGRFHHAQSQVHRFLNSVGGYVRHQDSYSLGAARVLMPHIVAPMDELMSMHTPWDVMAEHCKLFVSFGGVPHKNSQINAGGATKHHVKGGLYGMRAKGVRFVNVTPTADDLDTGGAVEWLAIRPNTDTALILALCHTLLAENLHDRDFLARYTVGFEKFAPSLAGKDAAWAEKITGIPASRIAALAREMAATRTTVSINWSLQRSHHGEQPFWAMITLACMLGQVGLPGGGFAVGYGPVNLMGSAFPKYSGPTLAAGHQRRERLHPGRALHRHAAAAGRHRAVQRPRPRLSRHPAGLLGGRQSVPSPPGPQPPDAGLAQARDHRVPRAVLDAGRAHGRHRAAGHHQPGARRHRLRQPRALPDRHEEGARAGRRGARRLLDLRRARRAGSARARPTPKAATPWRG